MRPFGGATSSTGLHTRPPAVRAAWTAGHAPPGGPSTRAACTSCYPIEGALAQRTHRPHALMG
eukprot:4646429-Alexandrium_andersonii.AAC.1